MFVMELIYLSTADSYIVKPNSIFRYGLFNPLFDKQMDFVPILRNEDVLNKVAETFLRRYSRYRNYIHIK